MKFTSIYKKYYSKNRKLTNIKNKQNTKCKTVKTIKNGRARRSIIKRKFSNINLRGGGLPFLKGVFDKSLFSKNRRANENTIWRVTKPKLLEKSNLMFSLSYKNKKDDEQIQNKHYEIRYTELSIPLLQYAINTANLCVLQTENVFNNSVYFNFGTIPSLVIERTLFSPNKSGSDNLWYNVIETGVLKNYSECLATYLDINSNNYLCNVFYNNKLYISHQHIGYVRLIASNLSNIIKNKEKTTTNKLPTINILNTTTNNTSTNTAHIKKLNTTTNNTSTNNESTEIYEKAFNCDVTGIDEKYIIVEKIECDNTNYVICGYPEINSMRPYIDLLKKNETIFNEIYKDHNETFIKDITNINNSFYTDEHINRINRINTSTTDIYKLYLNDKEYPHIYILMQYVLAKYPTENQTLLKSFFDKYIKCDDLQNYTSIPACITADDKIFIDNYIKVYRKCFNDIGNRYLNKPRLNIKYIFLVYKESTKQDSGKPLPKYIPAFFNFREMKHEHKIILNTIKELITTKIPQIFNIFDKTTNDNNDNNDNNYKLFYSYHKYGDFFHIKTEYIHSMLNLSQLSHNLINIITLDELIYMLSINKPLTNLTLNYVLKLYRFSDNNKPKPKLSVILNSTEKTIPIFRFRFNPNKPNKPNNITITNHFNNKLTKILLLYKEKDNSYTCIYKASDENASDENASDENASNEKFYIIKFNSNLLNIVDTIRNKIDTFIINDNFNIIDEIYKSIDERNHSRIQNLIQIPELNLYKITYFKILDKEDCEKTIFRFNPIYLVNNKIIDINDITQHFTILSDLPPLQEEIANIKKSTNHLYKRKPILLYNYMKSQFYIDSLSKYIVSLSKDTTNTPKPNSEPFCVNSKEIIKDYNEVNYRSSLFYYGITPVIKCIYFNVEGYNFIEIILLAVLYWSRSFQQSVNSVLYSLQSPILSQT